MFRLSKNELYMAKDEGLENNLFVMEIFAKRLSSRAQELEISDAEVARRAGLGARRYGHYVEGRSTPDYTVLLAICRALDCTADFLLGLRKTPKPAPTIQIARPKKTGHIAIPIASYVGAGAEVELAQDVIDWEYISTEPGSGVVVRGESQVPRYDDGDLIVTDENRQTSPDDGLYRECLVHLADGRFLIKTILPGRKRGFYTLVSYNAAPIIDARVEWCVPFKHRVILCE